MLTTHPRRSTALRIASAWLVVIAAGATAAEPAKKDSSARVRPKQATFSASVEPAQAKAGDTVKYTAKAKVSSPWHIYKYEKVQKGEGPRSTRFDFYDPAGLKLQGDWKPSREPTKKQEPAFPDIAFVEFYEDEVSWSIDLVVPPGTEPGKKVLRCQVGYQLCDPKSCTNPGQWGLPDVELTILPGGVAAAAGPAPAEGTTKRGEPQFVVRVLERATSDPADAGAMKAATVSEVEAKLKEGLGPFLLFSALGGLLALVMPCVWPMVPITVNFFVKQGEKSGQGTTGLAVAYCLSIIGVFTLIGVLFSAFFGAASLSKLANNPWLNFAVAALFIGFGLSLLGLFEIRLPNFLLNASSQGEGRGGFVGVMFMALTLTITSFTCTFPVVGGLLVMAGGGQYFYPVLGLATFATVLALPFFLLALAPGLLSKMPKSGDWMNAVKVVGGLVEIGAAFKFLNTAEVAFVVPREAFFNAAVVLTLWIAIALVCGIYLLGLFRTDHDVAEVKIGPGRLVFGVLFLGIALYFTPALFGRPPQGKPWYLVAGLLPADAADLRAKSSEGGGPASGEKTASSKDPAQAEREQATVHGVAWGMSYDGALEQARADGKPVLIDFTGVNCANCRLMEQEVLPRPDVIELLGQFVTIQLYTDFVPIDSITADQREALAEKNLEREVELTSEATNPFYVALNSDGKVIGSLGGKRSPAAFIEFLKGALAKHGGTSTTAPTTAAR